MVFHKYINNQAKVTKLFLARSSCGTISGHEPIIGQYETWCAEAHYHIFHFKIHSKRIKLELEDKATITLMCTQLNLIICVFITILYNSVMPL